MIKSLKSWLWRYFSGKLVVTQFIAGSGAFLSRSLAAYLTGELSAWSNALASVLASHAGYITTYAFAYIIIFRKDYHRRGQSIGFDILRLQLIEQSPNVITTLLTVLSQGALIKAGLSPVVSANLAAWFGPQKILNWAAAIVSNTMKKSWVDRTWSPAAAARRIVRFLHR